MSDQAVENAQRFVDTLNVRADQLRRSAARDIALANQLQRVATELDHEIRNGLESA